jgi:hypothetical protein
MNKINLEQIRKAVKGKNYLIKRHARKRMVERGITLGEVTGVIERGKIVEQNPKARPFPKCLILGFVRNGKPLYVSCAFDGETAYIITVHWYDPNKWFDPWTRRRITP